MTAQSATAMQTSRGSVPVRQSVGDAISDFDRIYDLIARRAFELFEDNGRWPGHELDDWFRAEAELVRPLPIEVKEADGDFTVRAEVPGFSTNELEITLEPRCLRISGKRETTEEKKGKTVRSELRSDQILRAIDLPVDVDTSKASASLKDGVLTIALPKAAHARAVRIDPKSA